MQGYTKEQKIEYRLCWRDRKTCEYGYSVWMEDPVQAWEELFRTPTTEDRMYWLEIRRHLPIKITEF
jgi:hypothetical protein